MQCSHEFLLHTNFFFFSVACYRAPPALRPAKNIRLDLATVGRKMLAPMAALGRRATLVASVTVRPRVAVSRIVSFGTVAKPREAEMHSLLTEKLQATVVQVKDVSGGCGDFFQLVVVSPKFEGVSMIRQHRMVNEVLEAQIGKMHGLTLRTMSPSKWQETVAAQAT